MADCRETLEELERYLDSELPSERVAQIVDHLKGCTDCQGAYEFHYELRACPHSGPRCRSETPCNRVLDHIYLS